MPRLTSLPVHRPDRYLPKFTGYAFDEGQPHKEAEGLLPLLKPPTCETVENLRRLIDVSPDDEKDLLRELKRGDVDKIIRKRRQILHIFDTLTGRKPAESVTRGRREKAQDDDEPN